jgi:hypothetical protein
MPHFIQSYLMETARLPPNQEIENGGKGIPLDAAICGLYNMRGTEDLQIIVAFRMGN